MAKKFQTPFAHDRQIGLTFKNPSLTQQCQAFEADINNIVNGIVPPTVKTERPTFGTVFNVNQYENAINLIARANSEFEQLPAAIRHRFDNNPKNLITFMNNSQNYEEGVKLGLLDKKPQDTSKMPIEVTTDPTKTVVKPSLETA